MQPLGVKPNQLRDLHQVPIVGNSVPIGRPASMVVGGTSGDTGSTTTDASSPPTTGAAGSVTGTAASTCGCVDSGSSPPLGARDIGRADFKLDGSGRPCFLEINLLPGLNPDYSIYPAQARAAEMSYPELIGAVLERALHLADSGGADQTLSEESFPRAS